MAYTTSFRASLDDLALRAVQVGRDLSEALRSYKSPQGSPEWSRLAAAQRRLADGDVLDPRDTLVLETLSIALDEAIITEVTGTYLELVYAGHDEEGDEVWGLAKVPTFTTRGNELLRVQHHLEELLGLRRLVQDQLAAQKALASAGR